MKILMVGVKHTNDDHKLAPQRKQPNRVTGRQTDKRWRTQAETVAQQGEVVSLNLNYNPCKIKFSGLTSRQANIHTDIWIVWHTVTQTGPPPPPTHTRDKHTGHTYTGEMHTNTGETHTHRTPPPPMGQTYTGHTNTGETHTHTHTHTYDPPSPQTHTVFVTHLSSVAARMYFPLGENLTNETGGLSSSAQEDVINNVHFNKPHAYYTWLSSTVMSVTYTQQS